MNRSILWLLALTIVTLSASATDLTISGSGTAESPYLIGTAADWNNLAEYMATNTDSLTGKYVQLTADIDFSAETIKPLGYDRVAIFNGTLDGDGRCVANISSAATASGYGGLIVTAGADSYIHDITVTGNITSDYTYCGGVVGYLYGDMSNVTSRVAVSSTANYAAGIVAYVGEGCSLTGCVSESDLTTSAMYLAGVAARTHEGATFVDCGNRGSVTLTGDKTASRVCGLVSWADPCALIRCFNEGEVSSTSSSSGKLTGLLGYAYSESTTTGTFYLKECWNSGNVTSPYNNAGIIGDAASYTSILMEDCYNTGDITSTYASAKTSSAYNAGIMAQLAYNSTYRRCWNSGKITSVGCYYTAGLFGYKDVVNNSSKTTTIVGCYNTGEVASEGSYAAGILAAGKAYLYIDSCYNTGAVSAGTYVGGITGYLTVTTTSISNCYNTGDITAATSYAGGIAGSLPTRSSLTYCFNTGAVTSSSSVQGRTSGTSGFAIGGIAGQCGASLTNVYNVGEVTGASLVGGIIGTTVVSSATYPTVDYAYSCGKVLAPADSCGNIVGNNLINNGTYWNDNCGMSNVYFLSENDAVGDTITSDTLSAAICRAELAKLDLGDDWTAGDNYTYPRLTTLADNDWAKAYAAAVIPADGDSYASITQGFNVGTPDGVTWTASTDAITFDGNTATFTETVNGTVTLTATCGDVSVTTEVTCNVEVDGISDITGGGREVVEERFYNLAGAQVAEPAEGTRAIYIVVKSYSDGTTETVKEIR